MIQRLRREYPKKSLEEVMVKEIGNSLYGKLAQGLSDKTAFDTATGLSKKIGPSAVTNPYMAAHTTGLIRAVCGELLHRIPAHRTVVSVTTDGFLTDAPLEELDQTGPLCRRYQALCQRGARQRKACQQASCRRARRRRARPIRRPLTARPRAHGAPPAIYQNQC